MPVSFHRSSEERPSGSDERLFSADDLPDALHHRAQPVRALRRQVIVQAQPRQFRARVDAPHLGGL